MVYSIKFGTDGWRAIIAKDYTVENVRRIAVGTLAWMQKRAYKRVVIGFDCRFGGPLFQEEIANILSQGGIECLINKNFISTPMVSLAVVNHKADLGIVITASHNPPSYNGYKLKSSYGGPTIPADIAELEAMIPDRVELNSLANIEGNVNLKEPILIDAETEYLDHIYKSFDIPQIRSKNKIAYDAMFGAGQNVMKKLFPEMKAFHCEHNPGFQNRAPEPILKNLLEIQKFLQSNHGQYIGIANDGDADRLAMLDEYGNMIDSHHILLLLMHYLAGFKKMDGAAVVSFSVTNKLQQLAAHYNMKCIITKIGFKYISEYMITEDVLVAGEESGGLAIKGHIPERDGIFIALTILQFMAETGKSITQLIEEVYSIVGPFAYDRLDLHLTDPQIAEIKEALKKEKTNWGPLQVKRFENLDGAKYYFEDDAWMMIRTSGTEPVLRIYAQGKDMEEVQQILNLTRAELNV
ncbi:MAG: phosphoglucomutase/phosphomannomutase family protein [Saprospiraceae bacterium]|nr:phosphoglucomutase/phosphomannomutase family protein [Saprospiraceae bacterium]